jgi:hypothetical protein
MRDGPVIDLSQVILVNKFGESLAPIMLYGFCGGGSFLKRRSYDLRPHLPELVDEAFGGVVEDLGVDEGELGAADSVGLHLLELAKDLGLFYGGTEPPPADHGPGVSGGILEALFEGGAGWTAVAGDWARLEEQSRPRSETV